MSRRALVDTGAIFAFVTRTDRHHETARHFVRDWLDAGGSFLLLDVVFAETMTLCKARLGSPTAVRVGTELRRNPIWQWTSLGEDGEENTWRTFRRFDDKEWSYTDCSILVIARREDIKEVFGFDHHFEQMPEIDKLPRGT